MSKDQAQGSTEGRMPAAGTGVDRAQIERMLDLSPVERLRVLEDWLDGIADLRRLLDQGESVGKTG